MAENPTDILDNLHAGMFKAISEYFETTPEEDDEVMELFDCSSNELRQICRGKSEYFHVMRLLEMISSAFDAISHNVSDEGTTK
jgi:hypothetical protein